MRIEATQWTASVGTSLVIRCWCGGQFSHPVRGRQDRIANCPHCAAKSDLRVMLESARMAENDADLSFAA